MVCPQLFITIKTTYLMSTMLRGGVKLISPLGFQELFTSCTERVVPVDATWYLPNVKKFGFDTFKASRIPKSVFVDIDKVKDVSSPYPHMLPPPGFFQRYMSGLGLRNSDHLVVYDQIGNFSAPRAAWMFDVFKHKNIYLLDNFHKYKNENFPIDSEPIEKESPYPVSNYIVQNTNLNDVISFPEFYGIVADPSKAAQYHILDARPEGRFKGVDPEPRDGLSSGHAPGTISSPASQVLDPETKQFLPKEQLVKFFSSRNVDNSKPVIVMCGTGVTACIIKTALDLSGIGNKGLKVYDGSWTEYAQRADSKHIVKD